MKRLLAYLFIVLGLGLTFNVNAEADSSEEGYCIEGLTKSFYNENDVKKYFFQGYYSVRKLKNRKKDEACIKGEFISKNQYPLQYRNLKKFVGRFTKQKSLSTSTILSSIKGTHVLEEYNRIYKAKKKTQIAKAEPGQTQKVASENLNEIMAIAKTTSRWRNDSPKSELNRYASHSISSDYRKVYRTMYGSIGIDARTFLDIKMVSEVIYEKYGNDPKLFWKKVIPLRKEITQNYVRSLETQIAKAEPGQTQKVANKTTYDWVAITKHPRSNKDFIATELSTKKKAIDLAMKKCYTFVSQSLQKKGYNDCALVNAYNEKNKDATQLAKKEPSQTQKVAANKTTYDWVAITKHPKRNKNFTAIKVSTRKKAIDIAMMKCYEYVTNNLSNSVYNDCTLVNAYNEKNFS